MIKMLLRTSIRNWKRIASSIPLTLVLYCPLMVWAQEGVKSYVLPRYPEVYRRARIEGSFVVEVSAKDASVKATILSHQTRGSYGAFQKPDLMIASITEALSQWQIQSSTGAMFRLTIAFRLADKMSDHPSYTYRIREDDFLPNEIIIEADQPGIQAVPFKQRQRLEPRR